MNTSVYNRCEFILRQFMSVEEPTEDLLARFHGWLLDGRHYREKNLIIRRLFFEALSDESALGRRCRIRIERRKINVKKNKYEIIQSAGQGYSPHFYISPF